MTAGGWPTFCDSVKKEKKEKEKQQREKPEREDGESCRVQPETV